jgi:hypothetical protein
MGKSWKIHYKSPFSIAVLNYQRVGAMWYNYLDSPSPKSEATAIMEFFMFTCQFSMDLDFRTGAKRREFLRE